MMANIMEEKIIQYFEDELSTQEQNDLHKELASSSELQRIFDEYALLYGDMDKAESYVPSDNLRNKFDQMLASQVSQEVNIATPKKQPRVFTLRQVLSYAAVGLLLCCMCYLVKVNLDKDQVVTNMNSEIIAMRSGMQDLLQHESTTSRIQAVNMSYDVDNADPDIIEVLGETLSTDASANVRLAAATALGQFTSESYVKTILIDALKKENDPSVQIELINILSTVKEKKALQGFDKLLEKEDIQKFVKDELYLGKIKIESI